jgi:hypothetical protein
MNPKAPANLDPKLKETYERVMGTSFAPATPAQPQPRPVQTTVVQEPESPTMPQPTMPMQLPPLDVANPTPEMVQSPQMPTTGDPFKPAEVPPANVIMKETASKKKSFLMPALLMIGGLIFFVAYAVIWAKVFGLF